MRSAELLPLLKQYLSKTDWLNTRKLAAQLGLKLWEEPQLTQALFTLQEKGVLLTKQTSRGRFWRLT